VIPQNSTSVLPSLEAQGILFFLIGFVALVISLRGGWRRQKVSEFLRVAGGSLGFFGVPLVVAEYAGSNVPAITRSALFALAPVVVVIAVAAGDMVAGEERGARRFLVPALIGAGGLLLLLPLEISGSFRARVMAGVVGAAVVSAGVSSVWLYRLLREIRMVEAIALVGFANALFFLGCAALSDGIVWRWSDVISVVSISSLVDVAEVLLIVWLLRDIPPIRFSSRYLVIPLVTVLESYVVERPEVTARMAGGTILLAAGAGLLLFLKARDEDAVLSLR
jgi:drug/metabolite transporter (DMT)-like permease